MDPAQLLLLLRRYHRRGDQQAREQAILACLPYVRRLARHFDRRGVPVEDLVQVGMMGAIKAVDRFDLERGLAFSTFLTPLVLGELKRHLRDRGWAVHVTRSVQELALKLPRTVERLSDELGHSPTVTELAQALDADPELVVEALQAAHAYSAESLNAQGAAGDGDELIDQLGDTDRGYERSELRLELREALARLDSREQQVILLRFASGRTQAEIATTIGCSQMHVSRIERSALAKLRAEIETPQKLAA